MQFLSTALGVLIMLVIDTLGAVASRKLRFNYSWMSVLSFGNYLLVGYIHAKNGFSGTAALSAAFVGLLDATIGLYLCLKLKAYTGKEQMKWEPNGNIGIIVFVTAFAAGLGWVGSQLA